MRELYKNHDLNMGYKHAVQLLERIQEEGLTESLKEEISTEILKFYERKGNADMIKNSF